MRLLPRTASLIFFHSTLLLLFPTFTSNHTLLFPACHFKKSASISVHQRPISSVLSPTHQFHLWSMPGVLRSKSGAFPLFVNPLTYLSSFPHFSKNMLSSINLGRFFSISRL